MRRGFPVLAALALALCLLLALSAGESWIPPSGIWAALARFDETRQADVIVIYQRLPRALIAMLAGAALSMSGAVLQGVLRNPLASPSLVGINAGAALAVVAGAFLLGLEPRAQGSAALAGGGLGFLASLGVARLAGHAHDPRGLALILSGAIVSMFLGGLTQALLLSDPALRQDYLGWLGGNVSHVHAERLADFWWLAALGMAAMLLLARRLSLLALGAEKAASLGIDVARTQLLALGAAVLASASAVAICGPLGFLGLVVPHLVRPLTGARFGALLPGCALAGACLCLLADLIARMALAPLALHTGVVLELLGGIAFMLMVRRFYLRGAEA
ncbi:MULTISPECIES: FecCD family ABC transporter permease [Paracoccus]|jgi:iron complex transport system permease protein|uniref:Transport system permease protein n=1 Tax=Paracoccus denitrificans (strain Pd 1222) TaxID=318586 RepID=A1B6F1_PARDP|nr:MULTISPECIES: iron ABC transporter permease [Paracoccus]ABL71095.1 transport system permease protein [Paracoccus denitrificans PD1222]MBB4628307.1 iron complex transport system permease protein [Paracoccus denitrificans]MCU7429362.1 iron ABC transporter permease [Paracoccus denitrificans]QAR27758.1 iron ABC transporter permease [Paracoccus denitrificans]RDD96260.1 iron ABC transporter permease [Paracoccus pantotrophus]